MCRDEKVLRHVWRVASLWVDCCRARHRSGVCSTDTLQPADWWPGSLAAAAEAGRTCPSAVDSCTWRSPAARRWPVPGRSPPGGSSPGSWRLKKRWDKDHCTVTYGHFYTGRSADLFHNRDLICYNVSLSSWYGSFSQGKRTRFRNKGYKAICESNPVKSLE